MKSSSKKFVTVSIIVVLIAVVFSAVYLTGTRKSKDVILVTHDSFVMSKELVADFDKSTGYKLKLIKAGDAGSLTNRLILTKNSPIADAVFGIDNTFSGLAQSNGILSVNLQATDFGDVCFNYDKKWFAEHKVTPPISIKELTLPRYKDLTVVENPNLSSTGLSFLAATIDELGASGWKSYWSDLKSNGVKVDSGWDAAYYTDFSGSSGKGSYPIVLSYASSPADEVRADGQSQTAAILDGCFRQTEYVAVLNHAKNPNGAKALINYLLGSKFQSSFPDSMYMYPMDRDVKIPSQWQKFTQVAAKTYGDHLDFAKNRKSWLADWSRIFG